MAARRLVRRHGPRRYSILENITVAPPVAKFGTSSTTFFHSGVVDTLNSCSALHLGQGVGDEGLDHGAEGQAGLDRVTVGGQLLDLFLGKADAHEALAALLAAAVTPGSDGVGHAGSHNPASLNGALIADGGA
jgi:hypothetical protein